MPGIPFWHRQQAERPPVAQPRALPRVPMARPRLLSSLLASDARVTLICAPAGFGKSTLMRECADHLPPGSRLVWLSLGGQALTPAAFLERLAQALQRPIAEGDPAPALAHLLACLDQPTWLVLDDYPRQSCAELDACLENLLKQAPHKLRWWINGRRRPAWSLPRLFLQGDLHELDARSLALDDEELKRLLRHFGFTLSAEVTRQLLARSDGWPAVACLLLADGDESGLGRRLANGTPLLLDYLQHEVLADIPTELLEAMQPLGHLPRFSKALCEHLLAGEKATELLHQLSSRHLLRPSSTVEDDSLRLWRPLADALDEVPGSPPTASFHVRACQWFANRGEVREAVEQALKAGQPEVAANYLQDWSLERVVGDGHAGRFLQWCAALPCALLSATPSFVLLRAWTLLLCNRPDEAEGCLADLARFLPQANAEAQHLLLAQYQALHGALSARRCRDEARQHCHDALHGLPPSAWPQRTLCYQTLAQLALADGDLDAGLGYIHTGLHLARQHDNLAFEALLGVEHAQSLVMQGQSTHALEQVEHLLEELQEADLAGPVRARLLIVRGALLASLCHDQSAEQCTRDGLLEAEREGDGFLLLGYRTLLELAMARGEFNVARRTLVVAERRLQALRLPEAVYRDALAWLKGSLLLAQGWGELALGSLRQAPEFPGNPRPVTPGGFHDLAQRRRLLAARANLSLGQSAQASIALQALLEDCRLSGLQGLERECLLSLAELLHLEGQAEAAEEQLRLALRELDPPLLLARLRYLELRYPEWLDSIPARLTGRQAPRSPTPAKAYAGQADTRDALLSQRERDVLQLIALGLSNQQIAERLHISVHTVKTHAWRINGKLGVERRTHAVAKAKAEGLL
ncbi:HTH-type transcriptional regulator MalT [compost metagenome]